MLNARTLCGYFFTFRIASTLTKIPSIRTRNHSNPARYLLYNKRPQEMHSSKNRCQVHKPIHIIKYISMQILYNGWSPHISMFLISLFRAVFMVSMVLGSVSHGSIQFILISINLLQLVTLTISKYWDILKAGIFRETKKYTIDCSVLNSTAAQRVTKCATESNSNTQRYRVIWCCMIDEGIMCKYFTYFAGSVDKQCVSRHIWVLYPLYSGHKSVVITSLKKAELNARLLW